MPYSNLPPHAFWKLCLSDPDFLLSDIYRPRAPLGAGRKIATAGSCFAQNIGRYVRASELKLVDTEPAPAPMPDAVARAFGYGLFSARYGNVYTARQLRQLLEDACSGGLRDEAIWTRDGRYFDALRPGVEPEGLGSADEVRAHRREHLKKVRQIFDRADTFIFTLGLTETWADRTTGTAFPTAPGTIAGEHDSARHEFVNLGFSDTLEDMRQALAILHDLAPRMNVILTVSPVPLTATASGHHVLRATTYSKSVLRAVAEEIVESDPATDYFPSYEIITGLPFGARMYEPNLRNVTSAAVDTVMSVFFAAQDGLAPPMPSGPAVARAERRDMNDEEDELVCEEAMLEAFAPK